MENLIKKAKLRDADAFTELMKQQMQNMYKTALSVLGNTEWKEALNMLGDRYRLIMMLYYVEGFKINEISSILEIAESTVRTRLARGREKLAGDYRPER